MKDFNRFRNSLMIYSAIEAQDDDILREAVAGCSGTVEVYMYTYHMFFLKVTNAEGLFEFHVPGYHQGRAGSKDQAEQILFNLFMAEIPQVFPTNVEQSVSAGSAKAEVESEHFVVFTLKRELIPVKDVNSNIKQINELLKLDLSPIERIYWQDFHKQLVAISQHQSNPKSGK